MSASPLLGIFGDEQKESDKDRRVREKAAKIQLERNVYAAANAEGIPHKHIRIIRTKSASQIIDDAKKKMRKNQNKTNKNNKEAQYKQAARNLGLNNSGLKLRGSLRKAIAALTAKKTRVTGKQARNQAKNMVKAAVLAEGINEKYYKYVPRKSVAELVAYARARQAKLGKDQEKVDKVRILKEEAAKLGLGNNVTLRGSLTKAIKALQTRKGKLTAKNARNALVAQMKKAVTNHQIPEKYFKYVAKKNANTHVRYARTRYNKSLQKVRKGSVKADILRSSGHSEADIKAAFCGRAK
jgi:hypothetical protein